MSMKHRICKSPKSLHQMSCSRQHYQHSCIKQIKMSHNSREHPTPKPCTLRVLVDMDGVICDFEQSFLDKFREQHPDEPYIPLSERRGFYIDEQYSKMKPGLQVCNRMINVLIIYKPTQTHKHTHIHKFI